VVVPRLAFHFSGERVKITLKSKEQTGGGGKKPFPEKHLGEVKKEEPMREAGGETVSIECVLEANKKGQGWGHCWSLLETQLKKPGKVT